MDGYIGSGIPAIYYINLDGSTDRRQHMETLFRDGAFKLNSDVSHPNIFRISAADGRDSNVNGARQIYPRFIGHRNDYNSLPEYACLLSHLDTIRTFSQSPYASALIFEDDVDLDLKPYWKEPLSTCIQKAPEDWEIIMLSYYGDRPMKSYERVTSHGRNYVSAAAYVINKRGAERLMRLTTSSASNNMCTFNLEANRSHEADRFFFRILNTYVHKFPYFTTISADSTIHSEHVDFHREQKESTMEFMKR